jgi:hypothetical protein
MQHAVMIMMLLFSSNECKYVNDQATCRSGNCMAAVKKVKVRGVQPMAIISQPLLCQGVTYSQTPQQPQNFWKAPSPFTQITHYKSYRFNQH